MIGAAILDTSWLLEVYRVPGHYDESRTDDVRAEIAEIAATGYELFVTVPVLFEVANHITRVRAGGRRRSLSERLRKDITGSIERESPWTIVPVAHGILLRSQDVIHLADRFLEGSGPNYSFADISIIDLANELQRRGGRVRILTFDCQLESYSG